MDILTFLGTLGLGAFLAKVVDELVLQPRQEEAQRKAWLREKRIDAFSTVTRELLTFGLYDGTKLRTTFQSYGVVATALLLIDDNALIARIDEFVVRMDEMNRLTDSKNFGDSAKGHDIYLELVEEGRAIVRSLRQLTLHDRV